MNEKCLSETAWYKALTLIERIGLMEGQNLNPDNFDAELAERRIKKWRSQTPFISDSYYQQRLATDGITAQEFRYLLGEREEAIKEYFTSLRESATYTHWWRKLEKGFSRNQPPKIKVIPPSEFPSGQESNGFLYAIEPLVSQGISSLETGIETLLNKHQENKPLPFDPNTAKAILFKHLPEKLLEILSQTMVLELNVARLQELLSGDTPRERFLSFLERINQRDFMLAILTEYPVLARQLIVTIDRWVSFSLEFLEHLCADWEEICNKFSSEKSPGVLKEVNVNAGDTHRGGRSVIIAKFSSGFQIVYKPKSLAVDVHFQQLLLWLNERGDHPPFQTLKIIDRGTYGWVEFVNFQSCQDQEQVWRFYQRIGGYLALLYALEATDFHLENIIAAGEQPIPIDLESLFHPRYRVTNAEPSVILAREEMTYSVLRVGLLPQRRWAKANSAGVDTSGIGATPGQMMPRPIMSWGGVATDEMRVVREQTALANSQNRPRLNDAEVNVLEYSEAIIAGFTSVYKCLVKYRDELLSDTGILTRFAADEVRVVLRPTRIYALLLGESFHPDVLRNALERDRLFDRLWIEVQHRPELAKVIPAEQRDLWQGDIPMFTTHVNSRDLVASDNRSYRDFFEESGIELVEKRLQQLDETDLERQIWFIRGSLSTLALASEPAGWKRYSTFTPQIIPDQQKRHSRCLEIAKAIGDRLELLALGGESDATWIGVTLVGGTHWSLQPLNWSLYDGISGVILFLAYLGAVTAEKRYTTIARAGLRTLQNQLQQNESFIDLIGGFSGWGGIIYTFTHLGVLWQQPELLEEAVGLIGSIKAKISQDKQLDIIDGAAGCIPSLLALYACVPSDTVINAAIECGDRLLAEFQPQENSCWLFPEERDRKGFAHGIPGIAWALLELGNITNEERFRQVAVAAAKSLALNAQKQEEELVIWCNSVPGVGLANLRFLQDGEGGQILAEVKAGIEIVLKRGFGLNHCLCHGDLGNLEFVLQARDILNVNQWDAEIDRIAGMIFESIDKYGWLCGVPLGVETPGLMTGIAGIGYGLLRLAEPQRIPSVLMLDPPILS
ncbi:MAG: type 2 lanthipeptide synthetase LanM family protein [Cyanobacteria bacterium P01_H01_bin.35]